MLVFLFLFFVQNVPVNIIPFNSFMGWVNIVTGSRRASKCLGTTLSKCLGTTLSTWLFFFFIK